MPDSKTYRGATIKTAEINLTQAHVNTKHFMTTKKTKVAYNLVMDEDRDEALSMMLSYMDNIGAMPHFVDWLKTEKLHEAWMGFMKEHGDKQHGLGWCKASDCNWDK